MKKRIISIVLAMLIAAGISPVGVFADGTGNTVDNVDTADKEYSASADETVYDIPEVMEGETVRSDGGGHIAFINPGKTAQSGDGKLPRDGRSGEDDLPDYFNSNDYGWVTSVKNQQYGDCWAHAAMASCETYMIKNGVNVTTAGSYGEEADVSLDLAENPLCSFTFNGIVDMLGKATKESSELFSADPYNIGGNDYLAAVTLMSVNGPANEAADPELAYRAGLTPDHVYGEEYAYAYDAGQVTDVVIIPTSDREAVKRAIIEYGAGTISYATAGASGDSWEYTNPTTGASCFIQEPAADSSVPYPGNHAVTVVGWDDNYSRLNFNEASRPRNNGAWIVKNSWGEDVFDNGYIYLSYEDTASSRDECSFYTVEEYDPGRRVYQYDNIIGFSYIYPESGTSFANVFTALGSETLTDVSAFMFESDVDYTLSVYTGCVGDDPTSGIRVVYQTGNFGNYGYRNIKIDDPVTLSAGQRYSVVLKLDDPGSDYVYMPIATDTVFWDMYLDHGEYNDTAYVLLNGESEWMDVSDQYNFRIKAFTHSEDGKCPESPSGYHSFSAWIYMDMPTCTESGTAYRTCVYCDLIDTGTAAPLGHSWGDWTVDENDPGRLYRECVRCGATEEKQNEITEDDLLWTFDERTGQLTVYGEGPMADYSQNMAPWFIHYFDIRSVVISDGVTSIGSGAFRFYPSIESITVGSGVKSIGDWTFSGCTSLTGITLPDGVESIGEAAFYGCTALKEITIPGSVADIAQWFCYNCTALERVTVKDGAESIGLLAFNGCTSLYRVDLPGSLRSIAMMSFDGCSSLSDVYYHGTEEQWNRTDIGVYNEPLLSAMIHFVGSQLEKLGGYDVKLTGLDPGSSYVIRFATGEYANAGEVKKGRNAGFIQVGGVSEVTVTLPTHGLHTISAQVGSEQRYIGTVTIEQTDIEAQFRASTNDLTVRIENLNGADRINLIRNGVIVMKINAPAFSTDGLKTSAVFDAPEAGEYTVRIIYADGAVTEGIITVTVPVTAVSANGRIFTLAGYGAGSVSYIRLAKGVITTAAEMKAAGDLRTFGRKYFSGETAAFAALDAVNGETTTYTVQIAHASGYSEFVTFGITPTIPAIIAGAGTITLTNVRSESYYIDWVRCAPGVQTSLYGIRHAKGSQVRKTADIVNGRISFTGLSAGTYTLYYLYDGRNLSEGMVTVTMN